MSNIQKAFKNKAKRGLSLADGGLIDQGDSLLDSIRQNSNLKSRDKMALTGNVASHMMALGKPMDPDSVFMGMNTNAARTAGMNAKVGMFNTGVALGLRKQPGMQNTVDPLAPQSISSVSLPDDNIDHTQRVQQYSSQLRSLMNPQGISGSPGLAKGGIVRGPGGPTDDDVPMTINGKQVNLSNKEAVLPAKTVDALGGPEAVEELIEKTNGKPPSKAGLRAGGDYSTGTVTINGRTIELADNTPRLPPPAPGTAMTVPPVINQTGGAGPERIDPTGSIAGESTRVNQGLGQARLSSPAPVVEPPRTDLAYRAGKTLGAGVNWLKNNKLNSIGLAGDAYSLYNANDTATKHDDFYNSDKVGLGDKALQFGRDVTRLGLPLATSAVGAGVGSALAGVGSIPGTVAGAAAGALGSRMIDEEGDALKKFNASNQPPAAPQQNTAATPDMMPPEPTKEQAFAQATSTKGLNAAKQFFPDGKLPDGIQTLRQNETNAPMSVWNSKNDAAAGTIGNMKDPQSWIKPQDGTGIVSLRQADGSYKNVAMGQSEYTDANGAPTSDYSKSTQYARGLADAENIRNQLRNLQKMNAQRNMADDITDPAVRANAQQTIAHMAAEDAAAASAKQHGEELGLRKAALNENARQFNETQKMAQASALKKEADDRLEHSQQLIKDSGYSQDELPAVLRHINENYVGGERQADGSFKKRPGEDFESLSKSEQKKMWPGLMAQYERDKNAYNNRLNAGSRSAFIPKPEKDYKPGENKLQTSDIATNSNGFWKLNSDDPTDMTLSKYLQSRYLPKELGGLSDDVTVSTKGGRVLTSKLSQELRDPKGYLLSGKADERATLREAAGVK